MSIARGATCGPLLAGTLGVVLVGLGPVEALYASPNAETQKEIVVTAPRLSDEYLAAAVTAALQQDPYIFSDHVQVSVKGGVVKVQGVVRDLSELFAILRHARQIAGNGRVVDEIEYVPIDDDGN